MKFKKFSQFRKFNEQDLTLEKPETEEVKETEVEEVNDEEVKEETPAIGEVTKSEPAKFFSKIFEARQIAHIYHLQVKGDMGSHASHTALNDYYDDVLDLLDELIETYQGQYDIVDNYETIDTKDTQSKDKIEYFIELNKFISDTRSKAFLPEDTHLQNIIDEIVALTYRLIYKLKFTK